MERSRRHTNLKNEAGKQNRKKQNRNLIKKQKQNEAEAQLMFFCYPKNEGATEVCLIEWAKVFGDASKSKKPRQY